MEENAIQIPPGIIPVIVQKLILLVLSANKKVKQR
jgi:hypothetical protein